jgi:hypothetical protein
VLLGVSGAASATTVVPYADPSAQGYIGLCNQAGQQITSGSVTTTPLAWRAISSVPARAPYDNASRTAILVATQPLENLPPADWSGQQMTASSRYSNPANPMAAATAGDNSLADFLAAYPANWDGFVQLRMYLGTANAQAYELHYPVLDLQVTGGTWTAVDGGPVNCSSGTAESVESILLPGSTTTTQPAATVGSTPGHGGSTTGSGTGSGGNHATQSATSAGHDPTAVVDASHPSHGGLIAALVGLAAVLLVVLSLGYTRRRTAAHRPVPVSDTTSTPPTKGQSS